MITSVIDLINAVLAAGLVYCIAIICYRLTLHPLAEYPGPFLAKITTLYDTYRSYSEDRHLDQFKCQQKYGNIFRYGPNHLVIQSAGALRDIYTHAKSNDVRKADYYPFFHDKDFASTAHATNPNRHAFKRKILSHAFSEQALHALEPFMVQNIDKWLIALAQGATDDRQGWSSPKNVSKLANYLTLDILGDLCFGKSFGMLKSDENHGIIRTTIERPKFAHFVGNSPFIFLYKFLQRYIPFEKYLTPDQWRMMQQATNFANKNLQTRGELAADLEQKWSRATQRFRVLVEPGQRS